MILKRRMSFIYKPLERFANYVSAPSRTKYAFALSEGMKEDKDLLSVKGANLCELSRMGYVVPSAFILSTEAAIHYKKTGLLNLDTNLLLEIQLAVQNLEQATGRTFGDARGMKMPLLLTLRGGSSVASDILVGDEEKDLNVGTVNNEVMDVLGAPDSWCFPGIKESCLGIGLNDKVVEQIAQMTSKTFAYNAYAHFLIRYGTIVLNVPKSHYRKILGDFARSTGKVGDELSEEEIYSIHEKFKAITALPQDPYEQLSMAVRSMYEAWFETEAALYRQEVLNMPFDTGLALIIQSLVMGDTGIAFSRNPVTGDTGNGIFGCVWTKDGIKSSLNEFGKTNSTIMQKLMNIVRDLELQFLDMIQLEYVIDDLGQVNLLQVLPARRTPHASIRVAVDLNREKLLSEREAVLRINAKHPSALWRYDMENKTDADIIGSGQTSSRGIAVGAVAFSAVDCMELLAQGHNVILVQLDADNTDERVLNLCNGLILLRGNVLSPPATLCRALGKPCLTAITGLKMRNFDDMQFLEVDEFNHFGKGSYLTMNASTGKIYRGTCNKVPSYNEAYFQDILQWAGKFRTMRVEGKVTSGATIPEDVARCNESGADNIGNIATDYMFNCSEDRLTLTRLILVAKSVQDRRVHLNALQNLHQEDFVSIIRSVLYSNKHPFDGQIPLGIKLLDSSLGNFLREKEINVSALATHMNVKVSEIKEAISLYYDHNPEVGLRGCRISALHPEITEMQLTALFRAVFSFEPQLRIKPHIWIPGVSSSHELASVIALIENVYRTVVDDVFQNNASASVDAHVTEGYTVGVVLDTPRACLRAETMIDYVRAFAIDLKRLTSHVYGCSVTDAVKIFPRYVVERVYQANPYLSLDDKGVGQLLKLGLDHARNAVAENKSRWTLSNVVGSITGAKNEPEIFASVIDGDQVTDPRSLEFLQSIGVDAICVPFDHVPVASLLAAQAAIRETMKDESASWMELDRDLPGFF